MLRVWLCALAATLASGVVSGWRPLCAAAASLGSERLAAQAESHRHSTPARSIGTACGFESSAVGVCGGCCESERREVATTKPAGPAKKARGWKSSRVRAASGHSAAWKGSLRPSGGQAGAAWLSNPAIFDRVIAFQRLLL
jgi:hypothetical protein